MRAVTRARHFASSATSSAQLTARTSASPVAALASPVSSNRYEGNRRTFYSSRSSLGPDRVTATSRSSKRTYSVKANAAEPPPFAFAFDIDGVLLHVAKPIPGAAESLRYLQENNIPFILLTNGGGKHEHDRVKDLSAKLGVELSVDNFVQSHTPFQELVHGPEGLKDKTIFLTGANAEKCRDIAERYGFKSIVTPADIITAHPEIWPFERLMESHYKSTARPLPKPLATSPDIPDAEALKIDAMFVFNDPRDWALDSQIIVDLLLSRQGVLGTYSSKNGDSSLANGGWQQDGQPPLIFSNADLFWSTNYHQPRFGQGAYQAAVAGIWKQVSGGQELRRVAYGKPFAETYRYAERVLNEHREAVLEKQGHAAAEPLRRVYMVGDNPESDIRGANEFKSEQGTDWTSVLVRTGVWSPERGDGGNKAKAIVDDVKAAVDWALKQEGH